MKRLEKRGNENISKSEKDDILMGLDDIKNGRVLEFDAVCKKLEAKCLNAMLQSSNIREG